RSSAPGRGAAVARRHRALPTRSRRYPEHRARRPGAWRITRRRAAARRFHVDLADGVVRGRAQNDRDGQWGSTRSPGASGCGRAPHHRRRAACSGAAGKDPVTHPARALVLTALLAACGGTNDRLQVSGTVEIRELELAPLAAGRLARLLKDEGDTVHRGDTIAVLEQPGVGALIAERRAQARAAALRVNDVKAAEADSARAANDLARAEPLRSRGIVSEQQFDGLRASAAAAAARLASMRAAPSESAAANAAFAAAVAIRDQLTVLAPEDGIVLTRYADPGEALAAGTERERADLVFGIKVELDDGDAGGRVKAGMPATVEIPLPR